MYLAKDKTRRKSDFAIGDKVWGDWEIIDKLGEGAFGKVYEIQKKEYGLKAALKVISLSKTDMEDTDILWTKKEDTYIQEYCADILRGITNEIALMTKLKGHDHIVSCEDYNVVEYEDREGWNIYIRMELLTPLQKYLKDYTPNEQEVVNLGIDLCHALNACQKMGILHRDIKPANIFITKEGRAKLGDFGIARSIEKVNTELSRKGTVNYMAPEVYFGKTYDALADIYSLGIVLYMLMNDYRMPFYPKEPTPVTFKDREQSFEYRMKGNDMLAPVNASEEFSSIILKACAFNPEKRYSSAEELMKALQRIQTNNQEKDIFATDKTIGFDFPEMTSDKTLCGLDEELFEGMISAKKNIYTKEWIKSGKKILKKISKGAVICVFFAVALIGVIFGTKLLRRTKFATPFEELDRIYVYSEYNMGVNAFQKSVKEYHMQLQEASETEFQYLKNTLKDKNDILQGIEKFGVIRNSGDKFIEYGPCALYQNEDEYARAFQVLIYENGYIMMECGYDEELNLNYMNFYKVSNLKNTIDVIFNEEDYELENL